MNICTIFPSNLGKYFILFLHPSLLPFLTSCLQSSPCTPFFPLSVQRHTVIIVYVWQSNTLNFLLSSSDAVRFIASTYKGMEGVNSSILVTLVTEPITTCLRSFTVYVTSRDGSATSECHATYYSQTNLCIQWQCPCLSYIISALLPCYIHHCVNFVVNYFAFLCLTIFHTSSLFRWCWLQCS